MAIKKKRVSPRQKMINLMYIVLMAMLALNVSSDVLNGIVLVDESLTRSTENSTSQNNSIYATLDEAMKLNPEKTREWYNKAQVVKSISDSLYNFAELLKWDIVREADGEDADIRNVRGQENLEAAAHVMLAPGIGKGGMLYDAINNYRKDILTMISDTVQQRIIGSNFSTDVPAFAMELGKNWQEYMFESTPVVAAITLLTKIQNDVRYAEGEVLHKLISNIDVKDVRVNQINAYVIPNSQTVVRGSKFSAQIIMAAVDTTQRPDIFIGDTQLNSGVYETICTRTGDFTLKGYLVMRNGNGEEIRREFSQPYTVVEPSATVSATMMNMLYAGYQNPISVSVPGVPANRISATMTGGTLTKKGDGEYIAVPSSVGEDVVITVTAQNEGRSQEMGKFTFHVRKLPDPTAYLDCKDENGNPARYRGEKPISKAQLLATQGIGAAIDDGLLDIAFKVTAFETTFFDRMGNVIPEVSKSDKFTERQKEMFRELGRGKRFYISNVKAIGPDGVERTLSGAIPVIIR
jgi:gliding motility-associated protein GldM